MSRVAKNAVVLTAGVEVSLSSASITIKGPQGALECNECFPYVNAVNNLFAIYSKSDSIANDLQLKGNGIEETTRRIAQTERQKISAFITRTQRLLLIALGLLCTIGPLLVYRTATYIVAPINRLARITRRISQGDITVRAPLREHDETYTLALSFNTMLDNLQLTQE